MKKDTMTYELKNPWCIDTPCYVPKGGSLNESPTKPDHEAVD